MEHLNLTPSWGLFMILTVVQYSCSSPAAATSLGNQTDRLALLDIKLQMSDLHGLLNSWNDSYHHCQWPGVVCNSQHHRVTALSLRGKSLSGTISPRIGNLSFMKFIHLGGNSLHGGIPEQIGQLSRLASLNLSFNNLLSGEIPVNLTRCSKLTYIGLHRNQLTGKIPSELGSLAELEVLYLYSNNLTGTIPASLGNLSASLNVLSLVANKLEGYIPREIGSLSRLIFLGLGQNKLGGEIPSSLFNISTLTIFSATDNFFSGRLITDVGFNLPHLRALFLGENHFYGEIPVSITNCTNLIRLDISGNAFEGKFPPGVGQLLNLQLLNAGYNALHGNVMDVVAPLTNCTQLISLFLDLNNFSGHLSSIIGNFSTQLTTLNLHGNKISGTIPMELGNLVSLISLDLSQNSLTCVIPTNLAKLQNLQVLALFSNGLSGQVPPTLCDNMANLYSLQLFENNLGGDLSHSLANCRSLTVVYIDGNNFSGGIPSHMFGSYTSPLQIDLSNSSLSGTIPIEIGKLANLQWLKVSGNKLSGHIPPTIGECSAIAFLDMHNNQLSGSLPPSLASLKGIEYLDLSNNTLTGKIPLGLIHLVYLTSLNLSNNDLQGEVPTNGVFANASRIMLQGNTKLCGGISELGLPACPVVHRKTKGNKHLKTILIPIISALVISTALFLYLFLRKKSVKVRTCIPSLLTEKMLRVSYHDLYRATDMFSPTNLIGSGSFGFVYKGSLVVDGGLIKVVAVKVLDLRKRGASKSFKAECMALSNLRHRNLVPLLTYCSSIDHKGDEFKALVYKYMENGSLDTWLQRSRCLNLVQRLNIAIDVSSALDHLHNHSHIAVAHCDVKPSNILLDDDLTAYVGDFGLARLLLPQLQQGDSSSTIAIKGTIGYAAPEYAMGLAVSTQGDVYSFGIMLLEMFTGKRPTYDAFTEGLDLHSYVKARLSDQVWQIVDPSLFSGEAPQAEANSRTEKCMVSILKVGIGCSRGGARDRMDMKQVTKELHFVRNAFHKAG